jgi:hypothetical protein
MRSPTNNTIENNIAKIKYLSYLIYLARLVTVSLTKYWHAKVKVNLSLCLTKHHAMKAYWGVEI